MSTVYESQLRNLFEPVGLGNPTHREAQELVHRARHNCPPGAIGGSAVGLPAVCAYVASKRLGNADVNETVAQAAASLAPKDFRRLVEMVERYCPKHEIISEPQTPKKNRLRAGPSDAQNKRPRQLTYQWLAEDWSIVSMWRTSLIVEMEKLELQVLGSRKEDSEDIDEYLKCAIFYFVVKTPNLTNKTLGDLAQTTQLPRDALEKYQATFDKQWAQMRAQISSNFVNQGTPRANRSAGRVIRSTSTTPSKRPMPVSPTKSTTPHSVENTPSKRPQPSSPTKSAMKRSADNTPTRAPRNVTFPASAGRAIRGSQLNVDMDIDNDDDRIPQTPSKRRKLDTRPSSPSKSFYALSSIPEVDDLAEVSPRKRLFVSNSPTASQLTPSKRPTKAAQPDSRMTKPTEESGALSQKPRRRFRPIFSDRQQWERRDPHLEKAMKLGEERLHLLIEKYGDPFAA